MVGMLPGGSSYQTVDGGRINAQRKAAGLPPIEFEVLDSDDWHERHVIARSWKGQDVTKTDRLPPMPPHWP